MRYLLSLADRADVICIQESRGFPEGHCEIHDYLPDWRVLGTHVPDGAAGGVLFIISPASLQFYPHPRMDFVVPGRIAVLRLRAVGAVALDFINMHVVDAANLPLHAQFGRLRHHINLLHQAQTIMVGDMNLVAVGEERLHARTGELRSERGDSVGILEEHFPDFAEVAADGFSRLQYRDRELDVLLRIDRALLNSHMPDIDAVRASSRSVSSISDITVPSDQVALELVLQVPRPPRRNAIPRCIIDHPVYEALCAEVFAETDFQHDAPFTSISRAVGIFHAVAKQVKRTGNVPSGRGAQAWAAHWLTCAYTSHRRADHMGRSASSRAHRRRHV